MSAHKNVSRRRFIATSAAAMAAPYIIPTSVFARPGRFAPSERINIGLIGCGGMGRANLFAMISKPEVQIVAVCDPDKGRRDQTKADVENHYKQNAPSGSYSGCDTYNDFRDLLARDDIDAVIQATPDHWHGLVVIAAARAGKDIYGEKPLSLTIRQGRAMSDAVARYGRVFQTGSQQRSNNRFRHACELVRNGRIGRVHTITCGLPTGPTTENQKPVPIPDGFDYDLWLGPAPMTPYCEGNTHWNFRWILEYSGGQLTDWGAHHIDIAHWGMGTTETGPIEVQGVGEYPAEGLWNAATNYRVECKYRNGVNLIVTNEFENGVKFEGDDGWVFVSRGRIDADRKSLLTERFSLNEIHLYESHDHRQDFLDRVRDRREPIAPIEQAHRTVSVAHLGNIAMQLGRKIRWDPDREQIVNDESAQRMLGRAMREPWRL